MVKLKVETILLAALITEKNQFGANSHTIDYKINNSEIKTLYLWQKPVYTRFPNTVTKPETMTLVDNNFSHHLNDLDINASAGRFLPDPNYSQLEESALNCNKNEIAKKKLKISFKK